MDIPYFAHLLSDIRSLEDYEESKKVSLDDIKRRLIISARIYNQYLPDYVYKNRYCAECHPHDDKLTDLGTYLAFWLEQIADEYLVFSKGNLYVKREKMEEWMEITTIFPPLLIGSAYFSNYRHNLYRSPAELMSRLCNVFSSTAILRPDIFELNNIVGSGNLLNDMHIHLNGTTETDTLWWSQIGEVDSWISSIRHALSKPDIRTQLEQLGLSPHKLPSRLRTARKLLKDLFAKNFYDDPVFRLEWQITKPYNDYPVLAKGAYFYIRIIENLKSADNSTAILFHHFILILGCIHRLVVQQRNQKGFTQFNLIPNNDIRWSHESKEYLKRFKQLIYSGAPLFLEMTEGRFAPRNTTKDNINLISHIVSQYNKSLEKEDIEVLPGLSLIAHFIKTSDTSDNPSFERHHELRQDLSNKSISLLNAARCNKTVKDKVVGIDAASNEMDAWPEVFAPIFRFMRREWPSDNRLILTYHAGEDFVHILSGLRMMIEAASFLDMSHGDRIGHGVAAGLSPSLWIERSAPSIFIKKGEWLDDLVIAYSLITNDRAYAGTLHRLLPVLLQNIEDHAAYIYGKVVSLNSLIHSWGCRKYDPKIYLKGKNTPQKDTPDECSKCEKLLSDENVKELYWKYHYDKTTRQRYNEMINVPIQNGLFTAADLEQLQNIVLDWIAAKNIALEVPVTSNLAISFYRRLEEHHLDRWLKGHSENGLMIPPVIIGSDDPGIFMTNIYIEYGRIMEYLQKKGYSMQERIDKVVSLIQMSRHFRFN